MFKPHECALHQFNPEHFEQCLTGRRIIVIGDSTMRQMFQSLACLMTPRIVDGFFVVCSFCPTAHPHCISEHALNLLTYSCSSLKGQENHARKAPQRSWVTPGCHRNVDFEPKLPGCLMVRIV